MKKHRTILIALAFIAGLCSCSKSRPVVNNVPQAEWAPAKNNGCLWSRTVTLDDGLRQTNEIIIGFREDGVVVWKLGDRLQ